MAKRAEDPGNPQFPTNPEKPQSPGELKRPEVAERTQQPEPTEAAEPRGGYSLILLIAIIVTCLGIIYYLANAHHKLDDMNLSLLKTRGELASTTGKVDESQDQLFKLSYGLSETRGETADQKRQLESQSQQLREQEARYRRLSAGVRKMRADYWRELQAMEQEKADRTEMNQLEREVQSLKTDTDALKQKVVQTEVPRTENVVSLPVAPTVSGEQTAPPTPQRTAATTAENYDFQLQREDGVLWLLNVGLDLKKVKLSDTDAKFDLEVRLDGNKITKKGTHVNEPIYLQVGGSSRPYRLVVTKIEKDQVKGYLSVPTA